MQPRVSRFLFSDLLKRFSNFPKSPIREKSPFLSSYPSFAIAHFNSIPNRPMRGDRRRGDDSSEDHFLRNLNLGEGRDRHNAENPLAHQIPTSRLPNRGGGEERRVQSDHFAGNFQGGSERIGKDFQGFRENNDQMISDASFGGKEMNHSADTLSNEFNFKDMGTDGKAEETQLPKDANEIFNKMKETGLIPNVVAMLDGLCKEGQIQEAIKLFGLMREKKTIPEVVVYTAVVEGFCKAAKFDDAKRIFRKMQKNGIVPNSISYLIVIQGLSRGNRLEDAVEFCMEMLDTGLFPNVATLIGLVEVFVKEKGVEEAEGFLRSLRERGFAIDDKAVKEYLDKNGPYHRDSPLVWEVIFGKKNSQRPF